MNKKTPRNYSMGRRAQAAAEASAGILKALSELWLEQSLQQITLEMVAERAGVTVRTVLRKYGSREGLIAAAIRADAAGIQSWREQVKAGDVAGAVKVLLDDYERTGDAVIRTLALESDHAPAAEMLQKGRKVHKEWCARVFGPMLPDRRHTDYGVLLHACYAATDVYKWKLLRRDLHLTRSKTEAIVLRTLYGLLEHEGFVPVKKN